MGPLNIESSEKASGLAGDTTERTDAKGLSRQISYVAKKDEEIMEAV